MDSNELIPFKLATLLCTRFCHDLAGPIGAFNNGLEYIEEADAVMRDQALDLLGLSSKEAIARLQFFRQAYGIVNVEGGEASLSSLKSLANDFLRTQKISLDWDDNYTDSLGVSVGPETSRLILNMILAVSKNILKGGVIEIQVEKKDNGIEISTAAKGEKIKLSTELQEAIAGLITEQQINPRNIQFIFLNALAKAVNTKIDMEHGDDFVALKVIYRQNGDI